MTIKKIVMAYDFSEHSTKALDSAIQLSKSFGAGLELLHVVSYDEVTELMRLVPHLDAVEAKITANVEREFEKILGVHPGHSIVTHVEVGHPEREVPQFAKEKGGELLILGHHTQGALAHFFLGSRAERIVRHAEIPVLVDRGLDPAKVKKILVPVDLSEASERALRMAKDWAVAFGAEVSVLHVLSEYFYLPLYMQEDPSAYQSFVGDYESKEKEAFLEWISKIYKGETPPPFVCLNGADPAQTIVEVAKGRGTDLIALGTHGRTGLQSLVLGSVAEKVIREAPCSVLTVH